MLGTTAVLTAAALSSFSGGAALGRSLGGAPAMTHTTRTTAALPLLRRRHLPAVASYSDFGAFEKDVRAYLTTLEAAALTDDEAPSPLAYLELHKAGRADLAEGCLQYGGYIAVSERLGVRLRAAPPPSSAASFPAFSRDEPMDTGAGATLSATAKEEKMAADLERLRTAPVERQAAAGATTGFRDVGDRLTPLPGAAGRGSAGGADAASAGAAVDGGGRYFRLDGLQRTSAALLAVLLAIGFGRSSGDILDAPEVIGAAQAGAGALGVAHLLIAAYGTFLASQADGESPFGWALKLLLTGPGGLVELRRRLEP
jgi:hypothetical protein